MIDFLKNYAVTICIVGLISGAVSTLSPNSPMEKILKLICGVFILFTIISPFVNLKNNSIRLDENIIQQREAKQEDLWTQVNAEIEKSIKSIVIRTVETETGGKAKQIDLVIGQKNNVMSAQKASVVVTKLQKGNLVTLRHALKESTGIDFEVIIEGTGE